MDRETRVKTKAEEIFENTKCYDDFRNWVWACSIVDMENGVYCSPDEHKDFTPKPVVVISTIEDNANNG